MGGHLDTRDFWYSLIGGVFLLGVVFFPTWRGVSAPYCGDESFPPGSPVEQRLGEGVTAHIHQACAIGFILSLALMSFLFARDEKIVKKNHRMRNWQIAFGSAIVVFGVWAIAGPTVLGLTGLYVGEVGAVWAFALSWLFKGFTLDELRRKPSPRLQPLPRRRRATRAPAAPTSPSCVDVVQP